MTSTACRSYNISSTLLFFILTFTLSITWQPVNAQGSSEPDLSNILELINEARAEDRKCGDQQFEAVGPLRWDSDLEKAAQAHSDDMAKGEFMSHSGSDDSIPRDRVERVTDRYGRIGENVANGQPNAESVIESWLNSPGHCRRIMEPQYLHVAAAVAVSEGNRRNYWTLKFGTPYFDHPERYVKVELDKEHILKRINQFRREGPECDRSEARSAKIPLHWYDALERAAYIHSQDMARNHFLEERGTIGGESRHRVARATESSLGLVRQHVAKGSADVDEILEYWFNERLACIGISSSLYNQVGVAAVQSTENEDEYYWTIKLVSGTPDYMISDLQEFFQGREINVYGRLGCSLTRSMYNALERYDIEHSRYLFDVDEGNHQKYFSDARNIDNRYRGGRGLPSLIVDNNLYTGFSNPAALYQKMIAIDLEDEPYRAAQKQPEERAQPGTDTVRSGADTSSRREESGSGGITSLTAGYINDEFLVLTDQESARFFFDGESAGAMLSSNKAYIMIGYGVADANEDEGEIRSISADLSFGGNVTLFRNILSLPADIYLPIRMNLGYRNLTLTESDDTMQLAQAGLGAGVGGSFRIPLGVPVLSDGLSGFISVVRSVGGIGDLSGITANHANMANIGGEELLSGVRLMQNTDVNIEGKLGRIFGSNTGVTLGLTVRSQAWSEAPADNAWEIIDVALSNRDDLVRRGSQLFFRAGINW